VTFDDETFRRDLFDSLEPLEPLDPFDPFESFDRFGSSCSFDVRLVRLVSTHAGRIA